MNVGCVIDVLQVCLTVDIPYRCCNSRSTRPVRIYHAAVGRGDLEKTPELPVTTQVTLRWNKVSRGPGINSAVKRTSPSVRSSGVRGRNREFPPLSRVRVYTNKVTPIPLYDVMTNKQDTQQKAHQHKV